MLRVVPFVLAGLLLLTALPADAAFHGVGWSASGVAANGTQTGSITVTWGGFYSWGGSRNVFVVTITDTLTGAVLVQDDFLGTESLNGPPACCGSEYLFVSGARNPADPGAPFSFFGNQVAFTTSQTMSQNLVGTYGGWSFTVVTMNQHYCFC